MLCPKRHLLSCPKMCCTDSSAPGLKPPEAGPVGTFSSGPCQGWHCGEDVSVCREAGRTLDFGGIPPLYVHLGKRGSGKIPSCAAMYQATSLSLNQPAHLLIHFNKMFGVSGFFFSGLSQSCHSPKMQKIVILKWYFRANKSSLYWKLAGQSGWYYGSASLPPLLSSFLPHALSASGKRHKR